MAQLRVVGWLTIAAVAASFLAAPPVLAQGDTPSADFQRLQADIRSLVVGENQQPFLSKTEAASAAAARGLACVAINELTALRNFIAGLALKFASHMYGV